MLHMYFFNLLLFFNANKKIYILDCNYGFIYLIMNTGMQTAPFKAGIYFQLGTTAPHSD